MTTSCLVDRSSSLWAPRRGMAANREQEGTSGLPAVCGTCLTKVPIALVAPMCSSMTALLRLQQTEHLAAPGGPRTGGLDSFRVHQTGDLGRICSAMEREGAPFDLPVRLGVVVSLEQVSVPGRHEEGLEE